MKNIHYDPINKRLVCDPDSDTEEYAFCVADAGTENWDCIISQNNFISVADRIGDQNGKGKSKNNGDWGDYCSIIEFTVT
jgi:hypothetical protein